MGRGRKKSKKLNKPERSNNKQENGDTRGAGYKTIVKENLAFETYYKEEKIVAEEEWDEFMSCIRRTLPASFRITGSKSQAKALLKTIQGEFLNNLVAENVLKPFCLPWYPDQLAWQLNLDRNVIRKSEQFSRLHRFLVSETESGNISRQETVSMIPPILLDVKPHHKVLDLCAAPGSKTSQLIEMLHAKENSLPTGLVVANDVDNRRCYMLVHQAKRLQSPCIVITNHDATVFPNITVPGSTCNMKFDRVLCDVPCSGDGTLRKNIDLWTKWNIANGNNMHGLQIRVVRRGIELLNVGGRLVYSTCSLNPVENEAIIHRMLVEAEGAVRLLQVTDLVKGLKICPGISTWKIMSRDLQFYTNYDQVPEKYRTQIHPHMFPPDESKAKDYELEKCLRVLPHQQDTGGFFVAVLEKTGTLPGERLIESNDKQDLTVSTVQPPKKKRRIFGYREDPFVFFEKDEPVWEGIRSFYGIHSVDETLFLTRCKEGKKKNIYFTNRAVRNLVSYNQDKLKIINTGVRTFVRCDNKNAVCPFRLAQEGLYSICPYIKGRSLKLSKEDCITVCRSLVPYMSRFTKCFKKHNDNITETGSVVLLYTEDCSEEEAFSVAIVGWKGQSSVRAYIPKCDRIHYLRLLGVDTTRFEFDKFKSKKGDDDEVDENKPTEGESEVAEDEIVAKSSTDNSSSPQEKG